MQSVASLRGNSGLIAFRPKLSCCAHAERSFVGDAGNTHGFTYCASTNRTASGVAIAKLYCLPMSKEAHLRPVCSSHEVYNVTRRLLAVQKVAEECGFEDIVPKVSPASAYPLCI